MDLGESIAETAIGEVREETGFTIEVVGIVGIYTDPSASSNTATARFDSSSASALSVDSAEAR
jgi:8-oxo-dGTP pyrophosphatase MutT (NUDIX family)